MKRILYLSHSAALAGAEQCLRLIILNLPHEKYVPIVAMPGRGLFRDDLEKRGIEVPVHDSYWWVPGHLVDNLYFADTFACLSQSVSYVRQIIRDEKIDLVHTNCAVVMDGALAAFLERIPHIWNTHEMVGRPDSGLLCVFGPEITYKIITGLSQRVIVDSNAVKQDMEQFVSGDNISVVHTGLGTAIFENVEEVPVSLKKLLDRDDVFKVLMLGTVTERKGYRTLMQAAEYVVKKNPNVVFFAAGEPSDLNLYNHMLSRKKQANLDENFHFLGLQENIPALLNAVDAFVLPSLNDPFPVCILEAMAAGKPVIATASGGATESVVDTETGFIVEPADHRAMAERILELAADPERASRMGLLGRERIKTHFGIEQYVSGVLQVYEEVFDGELTYSKQTVDIAEQILPLVLSISRDFHGPWFVRHRLHQELAELDRLKAFEARVKSLSLYKIYHALRRLREKL